MVRSVSPSCTPPPLSAAKVCKWSNGGKYQPFVLDSVFQISEDEGRGWQGEEGLFKLVRHCRKKNFKYQILAPIKAIGRAGSYCRAWLFPLQTLIAFQFEYMLASSQPGDYRNLPSSFALAEKSSPPCLWEEFLSDWYLSSHSQLFYLTWHRSDIMTDRGALLVQIVTCFTALTVWRPFVLRPGWSSGAPGPKSLDQTVKWGSADQIFIKILLHCLECLQIKTVVYSLVILRDGLWSGCHLFPAWSLTENRPMVQHCSDRSRLIALIGLGLSNCIHRHCGHAPPWQTPTLWKRKITERDHAYMHLRIRLPSSGNFDQTVQLGSVDQILIKILLHCLLLASNVFRYTF